MISPSRQTTPSFRSHLGSSPKNHQWITKSRISYQAEPPLYRQLVTFELYWVIQKIYFWMLPIRTFWHFSLVVCWHYLEYDLESSKGELLSLIHHLRHHTEVSIGLIRCTCISTLNQNQAISYELNIFKHPKGGSNMIYFHSFSLFFFHASQICPRPGRAKVDSVHGQKPGCIEAGWCAGNQAVSRAWMWSFLVQGVCDLFSDS